MLVRICGGQDIQVKACISILLLLTGTAFGQAGNGLDEASPIPWQPFQMQVPSVASPPTIPKEMVSHLKVANWPITLERTRLTDAQRRFGGSLGQSGDAGEFLQWLCLYRRNAEDGWVLWLTSGEIDGGSIGGFVWLRTSATQTIDSRCTELNAEQATVVLPIPLKLKMTRNTVEQLLGEPSGSFHETFTYFHEHKGTIGHAPYTWDNTIDIVYQRGLVQAIQVDLTISS
jgi:hypothetical protein